MERVYFDVTDVIRHAARNSAVVGIPRVQLNIISLLASKHGGERVRCIFWDAIRQGMYDFDPSQLQVGLEFDAELLLIDLGLAKPGSWFPSQVQIKTYLKRYGDNKLLRAIKKIDIYIASILFRDRVRRLGIRLRNGSGVARQPIKTALVDCLPASCAYVCLGAVWFTPEIWQFARKHKASGGTVVQMVHDLIPINHPHYYSLEEQKAFATALDQAFEYATHILCNSKWTAQDWRRYVAGRTPPQQVGVVPLAHEFIGFDRFEKVDLPTELACLRGVRFVLCVGTIEARKNNLALLEVWRLLLQKNRSEVPVLVFAGQYGNGAEDFRAGVVGDNELGRLVKVVYAPSDRQLAWLYQNCSFAVYPSKVEGWGLPVGESAWFGKYCVASNATSIPEVCGDLIDYVDPHDLTSITIGIERAILDDPYVKQREASIRAAHLRRWGDVADDIYNFVSRRAE